MTSTARGLLLVLACASFPAGAVEAHKGKLSINAFGSCSFGAGKQWNSYDFAGPDGRCDDGDIDFVFDEWRLSDLFLQKDTGAPDGTTVLFADLTRGAIGDLSSVAAVSGVKLLAVRK